MTAGRACAEALVVADRIGDELEVPVFLYGALAGGRSRAELRRGGIAELTRRIAAGELEPGLRPLLLHPTAGATLVAAREPLVAFNVELAPPATVEDAHAIAALIREGGAEGMPGVRAIGVALQPRDPERPWWHRSRRTSSDQAQMTLAEIIVRVRAHAGVAPRSSSGSRRARRSRAFPGISRCPDSIARRHAASRHALGARLTQ